MPTQNQIAKFMLVFGIIFAAATAIWKTFELFED
jgi:hypothetical protein